MPAFGCPGHPGPKKGQALKAALIMVVAVAVSFAADALAFVALGVVPLRSVYTAVDWPVILLLGAMLPVADAMIARFCWKTSPRGMPLPGWCWCCW